LGINPSPFKIPKLRKEFKGEIKFTGPWGKLGKKLKFTKE